MILVATIWLQAFTGTNFDFSSYSSDYKMVLGVSQVQLNYLAVASDMGKALGWSSGLAILHLPLWLVLFMAASMGFVGYGLQWLVMQSFISLPYFVVFLLCLLSGCSICWFNTICFVLCIRNFTDNRALALSLTVSFNGVSAAIFTLAANCISSTSSAIYLLLNAFLPLLASLAALVPILLQPPVEPLSSDAARRDSVVFLLLNVLALFTGLYLLLLNSASSSTTAAWLLFAGALFLLALPLVIPGVVIARDWANRTIHSSFRLEGSGFNLVDVEELELHKELLSRQQEGTNENGNGQGGAGGIVEGCCERDRLVVLGEEHSAKMLVRRLDFWFYFLAYFCGGTVGLVYSNNLGQIAQSLGSQSDTLVTLYSSCSFFGRLLSSSPDFLRRKVYFARTGWLAIALLPTPIAFFVLVAVSNEYALQAGTALIGLSSGFIFAAAVSVTSELFGPNSFGVNHNILITNIPLGSLVYGSLAALIYDANGSSSISENDTLFDGAVVCMGKQCYRETFLWWGCISLVGLASSVALFLRTRSVYDRFERNRMLAQLF